MKITYLMFPKINTQKKGKISVDTVFMFLCNFHSIFRLTVNNFQREAKDAQLDLVGDSAEMLQKSKQLIRWDRKKKKMVTVNPVIFYKFLVCLQTHICFL